MCNIWVKNFAHNLQTCYIIFVDYKHAESLLHKLIEQGKRLKLPKGQVIDALNDGGKLNLIKSGYVERYLITNEGTKGIQVIYGANDIFPLTPVFKTIFEMDIYSGPEQYYYESLSEIEIYSISHETLRKAIETEPLLFKDLFFESGLRLNSYIHRLESMSLRVANRKVANQLAYLADVFGDMKNDGTIIVLPLTHQSLAEMLNLARETVTHCLIRLQEKGLIKAGRHITILDLDKLKDASH